VIGHSGGVKKWNKPQREAVKTVEQVEKNKEAVRGAKRFVVLFSQNGNLFRVEVTKREALRLIGEGWTVETGSAGWLYLSPDFSRCLSMREGVFE
jgi:hypothetical protein